MSPSFYALGVSADVVRALSARGITSPFDVQNLVLPDGLAGLDVLVASPTGSGKTLAFGIPMIERTARAGGQPSALVLVPTRELASQVVDDLARLRSRAACGSRPSTAERRSWARPRRPAAPRSSSPPPAGSTT